MAGQPGQGRTVEVARCPDPTHRGGHVVARGIRETASGPRQQYSCLPPVGRKHTFRVVLSAEPAAVARAKEPPPGCPQHVGGWVVRDGTYGRRGALPKQRYRCYPEREDRARFHSFTPDLARQHVHVGVDVCAQCEEHRGVHRGEAAVARQHSWSASLVARALEQLASGGSYAEVSRRALASEAAERDRAIAEGRLAPGSRRRRSDAKPRVVVTRRGKTRRLSRASVEARNVWHVAADWTEAFAPVVWEPVDQRLRTEALDERRRLDKLAARGLPLFRPQVLVIDDLPVYGRDEGAANRSKRSKGFHLLVAAEVDWSDPDPFDVRDLPVSSTRLRLVRALARSNTPAWRLLFDELGYTPDVVVSDAATGQGAAVAAHYPTSVFVPSVWHIGQKIRETLADVSPAWHQTVSGRLLHPDLQVMFGQVRRGSTVLSDVAAWSGWWDTLVAWMRERRLPVDALLRKRSVYEPRMAAAIPFLGAHPEVPISTGGLETVQQRVLEPILAGRRSMFGNVERTNRLLDLAVAREHGAFDDVQAVARLLRADATSAGGWATPLREVADPGGTAVGYSSLRDVTLLQHLATKRGLT